MDEEGGNKSPGEQLCRKNSHDSDEWVVVNAQGTEIDNFGCQTGFDLSHKISDEIVDNEFVNENLTIAFDFTNEHSHADETTERLPSPETNEIERISFETGLNENNSFSANSSLNDDNDVSTNENKTTEEEAKHATTNEVANEISREISWPTGIASLSESSSTCSTDDVSLMNDVASLEEVQQEDVEVHEEEAEIGSEESQPQDVEPNFLSFVESLQQITTSEQRRRLAFIAFFGLFSCIGFACLLNSVRYSRISSPLASSLYSESGLLKCQTDVNDLRRQLAACKMSAKEFCERDDKPKCYADDDDRNDCKKRLDRMESYAKQFDVEHQTLLNEINSLNTNLSSLEMTYGQLFAAKRRETNLLRARNNRLQIQTRNAERRLEQSYQTELTLRRLLAQLENKVNTLKDDLESVESEQKRFEDLYKSCNNDEEEKSLSPSTTPADYLSNLLFDALKSSAANVDDLLNVTNSFFETSYDKLTKLFDKMQRKLDKATKSNDADAYLKNLKTLLVDTVGGRLNDLWTKAKDLSENLHNDCGGGKTSASDNNYCRFLYPFYDQTDDEYADSDSADSDSVEIHVHATTNVNDDDEEAETTVGDEISSDDENQMVDDDVVVEHDEIISAADFADDGDDTSTSATIDETVLELLSKEVKRFRSALKSTNFHRLIDEDDAEQYFNRLKRLFKDLSTNFDDDATFWLCQKFWWSPTGLVGQSTADDVDCSSKKFLLPWQTKNSWNYYGKILSASKKRQLLRQSKSLSGVVNEFSSSPADNNVEFESVSGSTSESEANFEFPAIRKQQQPSSKSSDWMFTRWRRRNSIRRDEQRGFDETKWIFRRGKEREDLRKTAGEKSSGKKQKQQQQQQRKRYWNLENYV